MRIMILGGSTSDIGQYKPEKSWPEFLFEKLKQKAVIFGGAVGGYNARQECLKLLRDIGTIKPDIIISYSGVNDAYPMSADGHPFMHIYQLLSMKNSSSFQIDEGVSSTEPRADLWLRMENCMCAIAQSFGCKFYGILQPAFYNKKHWSDKEHLIRAYGDNFFSKTLSIEKGCERYREISDLLSKEKQSDKSAFIYDLSSLFLESKDEIFKDSVHLYEKGNVAVANTIFKIIQGTYV